jgi:hypothetical protein
MFCTKVYRAIIKGLGDKKLICILNGDRYKHENLKTGRKLVKSLLSTLIVTCQLQVVLNHH